MGQFLHSGRQSSQQRQCTVDLSAVGREGGREGGGTEGESEGGREGRTRGEQMEGEAGLKDSIEMREKVN